MAQIIMITVKYVLNVGSFRNRRNIIIVDISPSPFYFADVGCKYKMNLPTKIHLAGNYSLVTLTRCANCVMLSLQSCYSIQFMYCIFV